MNEEMDGMMPDEIARCEGLVRKFIGLMQFGYAAAGVCYFLKCNERGGIPGSAGTRPIEIAG